MKSGKIALCCLLAFATARTGMAQYSRFAARNVRYVDSIKRLIDSFVCKEGLSYPAAYDKNEIANVRSAIRVVNFFLNNDLSEARIDSVTGGIKFAKIDRTAVKNGLLHLLTLGVKTKFLYAELTFEFAGDIVITRKFTLKPFTKVRCGKYGWEYLDFKLLDTLYARQIDYPIRLIDGKDILLKKVDTGNLVKASHTYTNYRFGTEYFGPGGIRTPSEDWVPAFLRGQYDPDSSCCYSHVIGDKNFVRLIGAGEFDLIRDLLFSPNYFYAINAMEAMIYLSQTGKLTISGAEKGRMELLRNDISLIIVRNSDVEYHDNGYGELDKVTLEEIVKKYKRAIP
jgi:hypothetical protein